MGWRGQHNRELAAEEERRAWWAGLPASTRWRIRAERYGPLVVGGAIGLTLVWMLA